MQKQSAMTVMFSDRMQAPAQGGSPSAAKPAQVVRAWRAEGLPLRVLEPEPATIDELCLAHDRAYVEDVLALRRPNGFKTRDSAVAASLPYTSGAMLSAARVALRERGAVCAPVSGFHHAQWAAGRGYCTFNGLMVTALALKREGLVREVAIIDCDHHEGDGTSAIIERLRCEGWVRHFTAGRDFRRPSQVEAFFERLARELRAIATVDLVLYQAGADPHVDDPLGGWMTTEQMRLRDARVFEAASAHRTPLVWNLAGGYQRDAAGGIAPVLAIHRNTALEHLRVFTTAT
jgi:acetoin utilization deacetylase AcuC-like enzyme